MDQYANKYGVKNPTLNQSVLWAVSHVRKSIAPGASGWVNGNETRGLENLIWSGIIRHTVLEKERTRVRRIIFDAIAAEANLEPNPVNDADLEDRINAGQLRSSLVAIQREYRKRVRKDVLG